MRVLGKMFSTEVVVGCSRNHGPLLVIDCITAPNIYRYPNGTLILRATRMVIVLSARRFGEIKADSATLYCFASQFFRDLLQVVPSGAYEVAHPCSRPS